MVLQGGWRREPPVFRVIYRRREAPWELGPGPREPFVEPIIAAVSSPSNAAAERSHRANAFARLFEAVHEGVYIGVVARDAGSRGTTLAANPHLKLIFGYAADVPESGVDPFSPDRFADPAARAAFLERLREAGTVSDYLLRMQRLDGSVVWVEVTARAEEGRRGERTLRVESLVRDVSERKKLDDQSRDLYQQLLQAEKMAALGQTISGVAHELNNPLATILSWAERLAEKPLDDTARRGVDVILGEAERAARIVRNLLTFARKRQSTRTMIELNAVVRETLTLRSYDQRLMNISARHGPRPRAAAGLRRRAPDPAGPAEPDHQRGAGDAHGQRPRLARDPYVARRGSRLCRPRGHRRRPWRAGRCEEQDLRSVLHDEGGGKGHGARADRRVRDRAGPRRPDPRGIPITRRRRGRAVAAPRSSWSCRWPLPRRMQERKPLLLRWRTYAEHRCCWSRTIPRWRRRWRNR